MRNDCPTLQKALNVPKPKSRLALEATILHVLEKFKSNAAQI
jgi:hypothetical protein